MLRKLSLVKFADYLAGSTHWKAINGTLLKNKPTLTADHENLGRLRSSASYLDVRLYSPVSDIFNL